MNFIKLTNARNDEKPELWLNMEKVTSIFRNALADDTIIQFDTEFWAYVVETPEQIFIKMGK